MVEWIPDILPPAGFGDDTSRRRDVSLFGHFLGLFLLRCILLALFGGLADRYGRRHIDFSGRRFGWGGLAAIL